MFRVQGLMVEGRCGGWGCCPCPSETSVRFSRWVHITLISSLACLLKSEDISVSDSEHLKGVCVLCVKCVCQHYLCLKTEPSQVAQPECVRSCSGIFTILRVRSNTRANPLLLCLCVSTAVIGVCDFLCDSAVTRHKLKAMWHTHKCLQKRSGNNCWKERLTWHLWTVSGLSVVVNFSHII